MAKKHKSKCKCIVCQKGWEALLESEAKSLEKYGWHAHLVMDESTSPFQFNAHTHHVLESFGHPDLEIVYPLPSNLVMALLHSIVNRIKTGEKFITGVRYDGIFSDYHVEFADSHECGRHVLRVILPDKNDCTSNGMIAEPFDLQWEVI